MPIKESTLQVRPFTRLRLLASGYVEPMSSAWELLWSYAVNHTRQIFTAKLEPSSTQLQFFRELPIWSTSESEPQGLQLSQEIYPDRHLLLTSYNYKF